MYAYHFHSVIGAINAVAWTIKPSHWLKETKTTPHKYYKICIIII